MLNKKGWGLKEMLLLSGLLVIFLFIAIFYIYILYANFDKDVIKYLVIGLGVLGLLLIISLITRPRKNKEEKVKEKKNKKEKKEKITEEENLTVIEPEELKVEKKTSKKKTEVKEEEKVPEEKVVKKSKKQSQKDAIKSVEEATMIIENFEKKVREKELGKQKEEQEDTMYDIFEDDRKRKKRK